MDGDFDGHKAWYQGMAKALQKRPQIGIGISNGGNTTSISSGNVWDDYPYDDGRSSYLHCTIHF
jgi:hypothetical protein